MACNNQCVSSVVVTGTATTAGVSTGTIAVGAFVAAAAVAVIVSGGGDGNSTDCCAPPPCCFPPPNPIDPPINSVDPETISTLVNLMKTLTIEQLISLQTVAVGLTHAEFIELQTAFAEISDVGELLGVASITKIQALLDKLSDRPAVRSALLSLLKTLNQTQLDSLKAFLATLSDEEITALQEFFGSITDMKDFVKALLTSLHPGVTVTFTTIHHGGGIFSTVTHMK